MPSLLVNILEGNKEERRGPRNDDETEAGQTL
jgi:hypothetical protein